MHLHSPNSTLQRLSVSSAGKVDFGLFCTGCLQRAQVFVVEGNTRVFVSIVSIGHTLDVPQCRFGHLPAKVSHQLLCLTIPVNKVGDYLFYFYLLPSDNILSCLYYQKASSVSRHSFLYTFYISHM